MTDSENSVAQDESDVDIYKDFSDFNIGDELAKVEASREQFKEEVNNLTEKVKVLKDENEKLKKLNTTLEKNLSTLLKTAQAEIKRKDSMISELRNEIDSFAFRRKSNKSTKDQCTNTEEWDTVMTCNPSSRECKYGKGTKELRSLRSRDSGERIHRSSKNEEKNSKQEILVCDSDKKLIYSNKDSTKGNTEEDSDLHKERGKEGSRSRRDRSSNWSASYRRSQRDAEKHSSDDRYKRTRRSDDFRYSPHHHDLRKRGSRDKSLERRQKNSRRNRSRSPPRDRYKKSKGRLNEDSNASKSNKNLKNKNGNRSQRKEKDGNDIKDALPKIFNSPIKKAKTKEEKSKNEAGDDKFVGEICELEEGECEDENYSNLTEVQPNQDWKFSFKNERTNDSKPMTLYSKRMMKKFSLKSSAENAEEKSEKKSILSTGEKEPGELTDDENLTQRSEEFREITKAAVLDDKLGEKPANCTKDSKKEPSEVASTKELSNQDVPASDKEKKLKKETGGDGNVEFNNFQAPSSVEGGKFEGSKEFREVIEFSPFKNNYKLIEISPIPVSKTSYRSNQGSSSSSQQKVEKSILNLLSRLSRIPAESEMKKPSLEHEAKDFALNIAKTEINSDNTQCQRLEKVETKKKANKSEDANSDGEYQDSRASKKKIISLQSYLNKKQDKVEKPEVESWTIENKTEEAAKDEEISSFVPEETIPGETTQFLNFFLLTTSPSKPILPAEEEKLLKNDRDKRASESSRPKFESDGTFTTNDTSGDFKKSPEETPTGTNSDSKSQRSTTGGLEKDPSIKSAVVVVEEKETKKKKSSKSDSESHKEKDTDSACSKLKGNGERDNPKEEKCSSRKRKLSVKEIRESAEEKKKQRLETEGESPKGNLKTKGEKNVSAEENEEKGGKVKEDITFFEFFKPIVKKDGETGDAKKCEELGRKRDEGHAKCGGDNIKMTRTMSMTGVVRLETPNKRVEKLKNLTINEHIIYQVVDSKSNSCLSPLVSGSGKVMDMTPRRMLRNDLMLTDSEDDSGIRNYYEGNCDGAEAAEDNPVDTQSENSDCESDSGASDFVDQL